MRLIAHRGNLFGSNIRMENQPDYIDQAIAKGFEAEIDLRTKNDMLYLGHDSADYSISNQYLLERKHCLWVHCKDRQALSFALQLGLNCFWHQTDAYTLTNLGYVWAYPGQLALEKYNTIMVMPELCWSIDKILEFTPYGFCSDKVEILKDKYDSLV